MTLERWKSAISDVSRNRIVVRGYDISEIMDHLSYVETVYLVLRGTLPTSDESTVLNAMLVSCVDHGATPPSVQASRTVVSEGNPLNAALAAGQGLFCDLKDAGHGGPCFRRNDP